MKAKPYDIIVFGASSFVGRILTHYLYETFGLDGELRWAAAGRSKSKLASLREGLGDGAARLPLLEADAGDMESLRRLCVNGRVIVSTVGPYALYGEPLVQACSETGTDYCDLAGEVQWIRRMITKYEATARASGARIVHSCGFDSIPSDLGVWFLQQRSLCRVGEPCVEVKMRVRAMHGGFSGGTIASILNIVREAAVDPALRRELADPYLLWPDLNRPQTEQREIRVPEFDPDFDAWIAPFVMSAINTRIVHRSNGLAECAYGTDFQYDEAVLTGSGFKGRARAVALTGALNAFIAAGSVATLRTMLERFVLPVPGEGPSPEAQRKGYFDLRFVGYTADDHAVHCKVTGDRDPGYGSTAKMLGQAAACLALDVHDKPGGFWTPATLFGDLLIERLCTHSGLRFEVLN